MSCSRPILKVRGLSIEPRFSTMCIDLSMHVHVVKYYIVSNNELGLIKQTCNGEYTKHCTRIHKNSYKHNYNYYDRLLYIKYILL